jgi:4-amino-4-deoxy-L-arabinose transferase-like glycosyltransferase
MKALFPILFLAFVLRLCFPIGHAFTDDSHYLHLANLVAEGHSISVYLGYPVMPQRIGLIASGALFIGLFGLKGAVFVWPMLLSLAGIILLYHLTKTLTHSTRAALIAAFILAVFPMDIAFASLFMSDAGSAFFLFLGFFLVLKARQSGRPWLYGIGGGIVFWIALLFKMSALFALLPLGLLLVLSIIRRNPNTPLLIALIFVVLGGLVEALVYWNLQGEFFYRFQQMAANFEDLPHDFFTLGSTVGYATEADYWPALLNRFFLTGPKALLLRRFYLLIPLIALCALPLILRKKQPLLSEMAIYFLTLLLIFNFGSSAWDHFQPLPMHLPWYPWFLFMPSIILVASLIQHLSKRLQPQQLRLLTAFSAGTMILFGSTYANSLQNWFNRDDLQRVCQTVKNNPVQADPFTKMALALEDIPCDRPHEAGSFILWNQKGAMEAASLEIPFAPFTPDSSWILVDRAGGHKLYQKQNRP